MIGEVEQLNARLEGIRDAMQRGRAALFITTLASLACSLAVWNNYFTWDRVVLSASSEQSRVDRTIRRGVEFQAASGRIAPPEKASSAPSPYLGLYKPANDSAVEETVKNFIDNQKLSLPLIGMSVSSSDLLLLGSLALFLLSVYHFLCLRRSNHEMGSLLVESMALPRESWRYVYFGIRSAIVFNVVGGSDEPYTRLRHPDHRQEPNKTVRRTVRALPFFPSIAIALVLLSDVMFACRDGFRFQRFQTPYKAQLIAGCAAGLIGFFITAKINRRTDRFGSSMKGLMEEFRTEYCDRFGCDIFEPVAQSPAPNGAPARE